MLTQLQDLPYIVDNWCDFSFVGESLRNVKEEVDEE